ncbi:RNA-guided pseudouridylation complex pseudouridine synthase subunit Cbf5 [Methanoculleus sp.]|uniref:RNA-guided pseudouridylation complex pseudouridine synthase subunit Cbf5 n=1 Tax=Methanoculleus sp. TaxID=90427 RepID=UPI0025DD4176|nr:RNA-guided pseudouridylation complex pseudouridine synthase subunit Cbf5 [Methanoculleus sp.]
MRALNSGEDFIPESGIVVIDKPRGPSSHQVTAWVGDILGRRVGHAGTLDPQVSGVLIVMFGNAVRLAPVLLSHNKEYVCLMRLHGDASREAVDRVAAEFVGRVYQRPPKKSAVKRSLRIRKIQELEVLDMEERLVLFRVRCDAGTYIRTLCIHMGYAIGTCGHMQELRRIRSGPFNETAAVTLHELADAAEAARDGDPTHLRRMILPPGAAVADLAKVVIRDTAIDAVCRGAVLAGVGITAKEGGFAKGETVAIMTGRGELVGLGKALVSSSGLKPGEPGLVIAPTTVLMRPGTYPRGWKVHARE